MAHYWKIGKSSNLNSTFSYQQGEDARNSIRLGSMVADPNPTYYRKLPSHFSHQQLMIHSDGGYNITAAEFNA